MKPFDYFAPQTLSNAIELLTRYNGEARVVAGGTDLLLKLKAGTLAPQAVINIKRIPELQGLSEGFNSHLTLGALTTLEEIRRSPIVREQYPALAHAASTMASMQIRNLATVGGNLCNAAPSADLAPILIAFGSIAHVTGPNGDRMLPLEIFFVGPGVSDLKRGELLVSIEVPRPIGPATYLKCSPRRCMDIAVVGVGLVIHLDNNLCTDARVILGAVAPTPLRARRAEAELIGGPLNPDRIDRAAKIAAEESKPIDDMRGTAWYRRHMIEVLTRRGLQHLIVM
jgi:carbon-monoxide dehydrogenase medium subunit